MKSGGITPIKNLKLDGLAQRVGTFGKLKPADRFEKMQRVYERLRGLLLRASRTSKAQITRIGQSSIYQVSLDVSHLSAKAKQALAKKLGFTIRGNRLIYVIKSHGHKWHVAPDANCFGFSAAGLRSAAGQGILAKAVRAEGRQNRRLFGYYVIRGRAFFTLKGAMAALGLLRLVIAQQFTSKYRIMKKKEFEKRIVMFAARYSMAVKGRGRSAKTQRARILREARTILDHLSKAGLVFVEK